MKVLFCDSVFDNKTVEPDYEAEFTACLKYGFTNGLFSYEEVADGNIKKALRHISPAPEQETAIYRGWMLKPSQYELLFKGLLDKNIRLINSPDEFRHCHYLPESYDLIKTLTPQSNWTKHDEHEDFRVINQLTDTFGVSSIIVKDYVKSEKHHWKDACYIPDASDKTKVHSVVSKFLELRGSSLNEGLVFRKFEALKFLTNHSKSDMPLTREFRVFVLNGKPVNTYPYWEEGEYGDETPDIAPFAQIASTINSSFFTMDIAEKKDGDWIIMELGDGQTAGLPENADPGEFYEKLSSQLLMT